LQHLFWLALLLVCTAGGEFFSSFCSVEKKEIHPQFSVVEVVFWCRYGMFAPGAVALGVSVLVLLFMKDSPEKEGFPPVTDGKPKKKSEPVKTGVYLLLACAPTTRVTSRAAHASVPQDEESHAYS
jgi:sugar phosphate permease